MPTLEKEESKCLTNWDAFAEAGLVPVSIRCQDYFPAQRSDASCHTTFAISVENVLRHMSEEHGSGGGFELTVRRTEGKKSPFWAEMAKAGIEIHDFRCDCDKEVPLVPRRMLNHCKSHVGRTHNTIPGGVFHVTLRLDPPMEGDGDEF
jgi:hypothetical protein